MVARRCAVRLQAAETFVNLHSDGPNREFQFMTGVVYNIGGR
jgi:hypothetical protein